MEIDRRKFIATAGTIIGGIPLASIIHAKDGFEPVCFGVFADSHYADREAMSLRYYRESLDKLSECVDLMNELNVDFLIELGDFKDQGDPPDERETLRFLETIEKEFCRFRGPRYHVLGNHDHDSVSKRQFLKAISNTGFDRALPYYSFDSASFHFVVLDANYRPDGVAYGRGNFDWTEAYIPGRQLRWLKKDLAKTVKPTVVFVHQRLDVNWENRIYGPVNAAEVRKVLEDSGKVLIVFQGHEHAGASGLVNNIPYYTLKGMIEGSGSENNSYVTVSIDRNLRISIKGYRRAESDQFPRLSVSG